MWWRYKQSNDATELVLHHTKFAKRLAIKMYNKLPKSIGVDEIECSARQGMWLAITRFDISRGVPFEAFARQIVNGQILDHLRENDNESRSLRATQKQYERAEQKLSHELKRPPTDSEIAESIGSDQNTVTEYRTRIHNSHICSIDASVGTGDSYTTEMNISNMLEGTSRVYAPMNSVQVLQAAIAPWTKPEKLLFALIYFESLNLFQAASILNVAHPHACQMHYRMGEQIAKMLAKYTVDL